MAHRTQLHLDGAQYGWLRRQADADGSIAAVVRRLIDEARAAQTPDTSDPLLSFLLEAPPGDGGDHSSITTLRLFVDDGVGLWTSSYVFAETYTALLVRVGRDEAIAWGEAFRRGTAVELVRSEPEVDERAWQILAAHDDKAWSYVDAASFAVMEREGTDEAFAFDRHFAQRGLRVHPTPPLL